MNSRSFGFAISGALIAALAYMALIAATAVFYNRWQKAVEREATVRGEYASFVETVRLEGEEAEREAKEKERRAHESLELQTKEIERLTNRAVYAERVLRQRPPARPDSSSVPIITCNQVGTIGPAGEFIPLEEFRQLEARSLRDTARCQLVFNTLRDWEQKGLVRIE